MQTVKLEEIKNIAGYELEREAWRPQVMALKDRRRVRVGGHLTFLFENRDTVLFQIQEMIRTERMVKEEKILEEIETYNDLMPGARELSATMFIEVDDPGRIREVLDSLKGIDRGSTVALQIGGRFEVAGIFEGGRSNEEKISAVHFVKFPFSDSARDAFLDWREPVELVVDHPRYKGRTNIDGDTRQSLMADFI